MKIIIAFCAGLVFGIGLIISGMTDPAIVLNFLDVAGDWDPRLAMVMIGALLVTTPGFYLARGRERAISGDVLQIPTRNDIDAPLLAGAALFGIGWGLVGLCPGPAIVAVSGGTMAALGFFASMLAGMALYRAYDKRAPG